MYTKRQVEQILHVNGLTNASSDVEIKTVLARLNCANFDQLLAQLRDEKVDGNTDVCGAPKKVEATSNVLTAEMRLKPDSIKQLLGIDVEINYADMEHARKGRQSVSLFQILSIVFWSLLVAGIVLVGAMWHLKIGFFHPSF